MVVNLFSDLVIDSKNHEDFEKIMNWEFEKTTTNLLSEKEPHELSSLWKLLVLSYQHLWNIQVIKIDENLNVLNKMAKKICSIVLKNVDDESKWENKVRRISKMIKKILKESCSYDDNVDLLPKKGKKGGRGQYGEQMNPIQTPEDVKETFGDLSEIKNPNLVKSGGTGGQESQGPEDSFMQGTAEELADEINYNTFSDVMSLYGYNDSMEILSSWYRGLAKGILKFHIFEKKPGNALPIYPTTWRIGDPIEDLDILQTILASPVVIPNITTRKWVKRKGPGHNVSKALPDMMIVIDSSGSMDWNFLKTKVTGRYHVSLLAAFAAMHYAIEHGSYLSAINFSSTVSRQNWTNKYHLIEKCLLRYKGNSTVLPNKTIISLAKKADRPSIILIISDLELSNWKQTKKTFLKLQGMGHKIIGFFIDGNPKILDHDDFQELFEKGARFFCINKLSDLIGLVISEVQNEFEKRENPSK